jgi:hypothetical protein
MMMLAVTMFVMVAVTGLERGLDRLKMCPEAAEHVLNHVVRPNPKNAAPNLRR